MSRNVLNTWDVDRFLKAVEVPDNDKAIRQWLDRVARRWILKEFGAVGKVLRVVRNAETAEGLYAIAWRSGADSRGITARQGPVPGWVDAALPEGVFWLDLGGASARELASELNAVALYFHQLRGNPQSARLDRVALPDAVEAAHRFRAMMAERAGVAADNTLMSLGNGFRFALLTSERELIIEGKRMGHCVGSYRYELDHGSDIVSLRDGRNRPHVTIEILGGQLVNQIKGKVNGPVALRYRRLVAAFIREMGLVVTDDRENAGIAFRDFDLTAPRSWAAEPRLRDLIRREIEGKIWVGGENCLADFYSDARAGLSEMSDDTWNWFVALFRDGTGRFVRLDHEQAYEVGCETFGQIKVCFPDELYRILRQSKDSRSRDLKRRLISELEGLLLGFCRRDERSLLAAWQCEDLIDLHLRRPRHEHQQRVRSRLARARRELRQQAFVTRAPYEALARWEANRRAFADLLHQDAQDYL